ncbi:hypothetical protein [Actinoplanes awajinensis]|uniref:hypothetical protein n=1 Tax=Actinoplanes awajinensis TaxID=135946 RepID=UPI0012FA001B|nr:hypothetical protein [Actinoplanes awajinensis]
MILTDADARGWRTVRRYAVPAPMIHRATERRLAGDWRGACSAADVAVDLDFSTIKSRFGTTAAGRVEQDLRHFAPDLLRWHLPRRPSTGHTALSPRRLSVLARYRDDLILAVGSPRTGHRTVRAGVGGAGSRRPAAAGTDQPVHGPRLLVSAAGDRPRGP